MKRVISIVLVAVMLFSLVSCNKKPKEEPKPANYPTSTQYQYEHKKLTYEPTENLTTTSLAAVDPGDPNFVPGSLYGDLPKVTFRRSDNDPLTFGLWCWDTNILFEPSTEAGITCDMLLDIMIQNRINEVYLSMLSLMQTASSIERLGEETGKFSEMKLRGFIKKCSKYGIKVYALEGTGGPAALAWMEPDNTQVLGFIRRLGQINANAQSEDEKVAGLHLDLEATLNDPARKKEESDRRYQMSADFFHRTKMQCDDAGLVLQYDINGWTKDDQMIMIDNKPIQYMDYLTQTIDNLTVMAYRNSAKGQWEEAMTAENSNEMQWSVKNNCNVLVGAETSPSSKMGTEATITYDYRGGARYMIEEFDKLRDLVLSYGAPRTGLAVHHADAFFRMLKKEKEYM